MSIGMEYEERLNILKNGFENRKCPILWNIEPLEVMVRKCPIYFEVEGEIYSSNNLSPDPYKYLGEQSDVLRFEYPTCTGTGTGSTLPPTKQTGLQQNFRHMVCKTIQESYDQLLTEQLKIDNTFQTKTFIESYSKTCKILPSDRSIITTPNGCHNIQSNNTDEDISAELCQSTFREDKILEMDDGSVVSFRKTSKTKSNLQPNIEITQIPYNLIDAIMKEPCRPKMNNTFLSHLYQGTDEPVKAEPLPKPSTSKKFRPTTILLDPPPKKKATNKRFRASDAVPNYNDIPESLKIKRKATTDPQVDSNSKYSKLSQMQNEVCKDKPSSSISALNNRIPRGLTINRKATPHDSQIDPKYSKLNQVQNTISENKASTSISTVNNRNNSINVNNRISDALKGINIHKKATTNSYVERVDPKSSTKPNQVQQNKVSMDKASTSISAENSRFRQLFKNIKIPKKATPNASVKSVDPKSSQPNQVQQNKVSMDKPSTSNSIVKRDSGVNRQIDSDEDILSLIADDDDFNF